MKIFIASDIHGSAYYCEQLIKAFDREDADRMLLLGDLLYHGPRNDLPKDYAPKQVIEMLNAHKNKIFCVRGNYSLYQFLRFLSLNFIIRVKHFRNCFARK